MRTDKEAEPRPAVAKRVSSAAIGAFVLASLGLAAIVTVVLGWGKLFSTRTTTSACFRATSTA